MKHMYVAAAIALNLALVGCGKKEEAKESATTAATDCSASLALGFWENPDTGEQIAFTSNCGFSSNLCETSGTVPNIATAKGTATVTIANDPAISGCLTKGEHTCVYDIDSEMLVFSCDGRAAVGYLKQ